MPWSKKDVDGFKKGLSDKQKEKWVATANSVLSDCMKKGGSEKECAGKAVRIANGTANNEESKDIASTVTTDTVTWSSYDGVQDNADMFEFARNVMPPSEDNKPDEVITPKELIIPGELATPKEDNLPAEVKSILQSVYFGCRNAWIREHPGEKDDLNNKSYCTKIAWDAVRNDGWEKGANSEWVKIGLNEASKYSIYTNQQASGYKVKEKMHQGKKHLVVPVTMMVEGVHSGSHGPLLHSIEELGKFPETWNGIPVVINHPEVDGMNVSANNPDIIDGQTVGRVYNTHVKNNKLVAEAWLDMEKLNSISPEVLIAINGGELLEVSLGMFTDDERIEGDWNGETYEAIAKNHRPDHLALLPCSVGACSLEDGCGLGVNNEKGGIDVKKDEKSPNVFEEVDLKLNGTDNNTWEIVTGDKVIAEGSGFIRTKFNINNNEKEVTKMAENVVKCTPCVEKKVNELIANSQGKFTEDDREWLMSLDENRLDKLTPTVIEKEKVIEVNVLSEDDKKALAAYRQQLKEKREKLVQTIQDNAKDIWTIEVLNEMDDDKLERLSRSIKKDDVTDYSMNVPSFSTNTTSEVEPLYPVGFQVNKK